MIQQIAITGALGNLGTKLLRHLATLPGIERLVGLDVRPASPNHVASLLADLPTHPRLDFIECDLRDWQDRRWRDILSSVDAVVHFAAHNPYPEATWQDAALSLDMTLHLANAALESTRMQRLVFATTNHVMGRYKDDPLWSSLEAGGLRTDLPPGTGTIWHTGQQAMDSTPYATAKLMGERVFQAAARTSKRTTFANIRIGWCQPGENLPTTLSAAGTPTQSSGAPAGEMSPVQVRADRWFKEMWLSNRDFLQLFAKAILCDGSHWPDGHILVNGMSNNGGMKWSLAEGRRWLGYEPVDDVYAGK